MYLPSPWHATSDCNPSMPNGKCKFDLVVPDYDYKCSRPANGEWQALGRKQHVEAATERYSNPSHCSYHREKAELRIRRGSPKHAAARTNQPADRAISDNSGSPVGFLA